MSPLTHGCVSLRVAEVARLTGASPREIRDRVARGELRARRVGRGLYLDPTSVRAAYGFDQQDELERDVELERFVAYIFDET